MLLLCFFLFISCEKDIQDKSISNKEYKLVWADEFEKDGHPNPTNWNYERGFVRNKEYQWYQPQNAYCENGFLIIEGKRERIKNPNYDPKQDNWRTSRKFADYTSASVTTQGLQSWKFGRFKMRAKINTDAGLWPAFWTLGIKGPWPHNGEIDIMEYYNNAILANFAWGGQKKYHPIWDTKKISLDSLLENDPEWVEKFHTWRMDWNEKWIKIFMDNKLLNSVDLSKTINKDSAAKNPFLQPHYLILNLAIGGTNGGDPSQTGFSVKYIIDYVRVYQKEETQKKILIKNMD